MEKFNKFYNKLLNERTRDYTYTEVVSRFENALKHQGLIVQFKTPEKKFIPTIEFEGMLIDSFKLNVNPEFKEQLINNGYGYLADFLTKHKIWGIN